jgi:hypothetical protein
VTDRREIDEFRAELDADLSFEKSLLAREAIAVLVVVLVVLLRAVVVGEPFIL